MNILYVCKEYPESQRTGGIGSYCKEIAQGMSAQGHQVTVLSASDDTRVFSDIIENGVRVIRVDGGDFWIKTKEPGYSLLKLRTIYRFHSYRRRVRKIVQSLENIDIIEVADYGAEGLYLGDIGIPVIVRLHTPSLFDRATEQMAGCTWKSFFMINAEKKMLENSRYITSCSKCLSDWIYSHLDVKPRFSEVILNPVSLRYSLQFQQPNLTKNNKTIFYAGTIVPTKGVGDLIEACKILREKKGYPVVLMMAGKEGLYAEQQKKALTDQQKEYIKFFGKMKREDLYSYYHYSDVCCFPSWWENMPMVCLEAMMCEGLVVGSSSGGMCEVIQDGVNGFLAPPKSVDELVSCLEKTLFLSSVEKLSIKQRALETITSKFDISVIIAQMEKFYLRVIDDFASYR